MHSINFEHTVTQMHTHTQTHTHTHLYTNKTSVTVIVLNRWNHLQINTQIHTSHTMGITTHTFEWPKKFFRSRFSVLVLGGVNNGLPLGSLYGWKDCPAYINKILIQPQYLNIKYYYQQAVQCRSYYAVFCLTYFTSQLFRLLHMFYCLSTIPKLLVCIR